ncbi:MAG: hypothetical protein LBT21_05065, partial [Oscillospiraceae bacterium]|nr:hypothetical protein [Oscillospiraceae bacterium]
MAYAFGKSNGNVPDEWIFNFQGTTRSPSENGKQARIFTSSPVSSLMGHNAPLLLEIFYHFS